MTTAPEPGGLDDRRDETPSTVPPPTVPEPTPAEPAPTLAEPATLTVPEAGVTEAVEDEAQATPGTDAQPAVQPADREPAVAEAAGPGVTAVEPAPTLAEPGATLAEPATLTLTEAGVTEAPTIGVEAQATPGTPGTGPTPAPGAQPDPAAGQAGPSADQPGPAAGQGGSGGGPGGPTGPSGPTGPGGPSGPGGFRPPPPPPGTGGYATRFGLVRPVGDRYIAGVCGAFARATNTDPVLWRVALPVLTVLGGFGILLYLLGWLLIPAEGDSASPFEALIGRGWSSTSRALTLVLTVIAGGWGLGAVVGGITGKVVVFAAIIGIVVLVANSRGNAPWQRRPPPGSIWGQATGGPATAGSATGPAAQPWWSAGTGTYTATPHADTVTDTPDWTPGPAPTGTGWPDATTVAPGNPADPTGTRPGAVPFDSGTGSPVTAGYRAPFAPGGPFATARLDSGSPTNYGDSPTYQETFPGLQTTPPPGPPARPPRRRSRVTRATLSLTLIVLGILAVLDTSHAVNITAPGYFAAALTTMGLGLMVGSLFGRSRAPIWLGILLVLGLMSSAAAHEYRGNQLYRPTSLVELPSTYSAQFANMTVDLRQLDFTGQNRTVHVRLSAGRILIQLPPNVDAKVNVSIGVGETRLFDVRRNGTGVRETVSNNGDDGPGGGKIIIDADIKFAGQVEVVR